jgi:hypothetical protein
VYNKYTLKEVAMMTGSETDEYANALAAERRKSV